MQKIKLTRGYEAKIDDEYEEEIKKFKWRANFTIIGKIYAVRERRKDEWPDGVRVGQTIYMHRFILGIHLFSGVAIVGDHINGNSLDNRRENLRVCSYQDNGRNKRVSSGSKSSRYKGVCKIKGERKWQAYIKVGGKKIHLGTFDGEYGELDAAKAYDVYAVKMFGEYANMNFPPEGVPF